jgi:hypothetical protein
MDPHRTARALAAARPEHRLPCPACGAAVKGLNLGKHLDGKHPGVTGAASWAGRDGRVRRPLLVLLLLGAVTAVALAVLDPDAEPVAAQFPPGILLGLVVVLAGLGGAALLGTGVLRARLTADDDGLVLRYALGTARHRLPLPAQVTVGGLRRTTRGPGSGDPTRYSTPGVEVPAGTYLGLAAGRHRLVVGCATSTGLRAHWSGWQQGPRRRRVDVTLSPADFTALQYVLHDTGVLHPRETARSA